MPGKKLARRLGWFSIGLGVAELCCSRDVSHATGIGDRALLQWYGLREIATGIGILSSRQPAPWMWARVAGDALDLATLGNVLLTGDDESRRGRAALAFLAVVGVTVADVSTAAALTTAQRLEG